MATRVAIDHRDGVSMPSGADRTAVNQVRDVLDANGFVAVRQMFAADALREVEIILDSLMLARSRADVVSWRRELSAVSLPSVPKQPEISRPTLRSPLLKRTSVYIQCAHLAANLLGCRAHYLFDHAIYKMPRNGTRTPWHQDLAYLGAFAVRIRSLHFWIPLQDTTVENGALCFISGSHKRPLLDHTRAYAANPHVLTADVEDLQGEYVSLARGDVSIHTSLTLHASGPNQTDTIRKAWILHFGDTPRWRKHLMKIGELASARARAVWQLALRDGEGPSSPPGSASVGRAPFASTRE